MVTRIGGLASGMDIDTMVKDLMKAHRAPLETLKQKKQVLEWQRDDYRSMNTLLLNFRTELTNMRLSSTYRSRGTTTTDESKVTATATSAASLASYSITEVKKLASAATKVNAGSISVSKDNKVDLTKSITDIQDKFPSTVAWNTGSAETQTISVKESGSEFQLSLKSDVNLVDNSPKNVKVNGVAYKVVESVDDLEAGGKQVYVDNDGKLTFSDPLAKDSTITVDYIGSHRIQEATIAAGSNTFSLSTDAKHSSSTITSIKIDSKEYTVDSNGNITDPSNSDSNFGKIVDGVVTLNTSVSAEAKVEVNYKQKYSSFSITTFGADNKPITENFNVAGSDTLNSVINKVNTSSLGVTMFYDSASDQMTLTRKQTGNFNLADGEPEIITNGNFINDVLRFGAGSIEKGGDNAVFTINGLTTERTTNTFDISGVTFTLKQTFAEGSTQVNIGITNNTNQIFENIKGFVTKYNELIAKIQGEVTEERYKTYTPLTDEQRESLTDKQQEQWEERAKSGMLRRDSTLTSLLNKMRSNFSTPVSNADINPLYKQLASIGIKTSSNYLEGGKLEIDEAALKKAIEADPASVEKLFNANGTTDGEKGIAQRLTDTVNSSMEKLRSKAGNSYATNNQFEIGKLLNNIDKKINSFENRLTKIEDRYWTQFTAMEKAIQRSNEQMNQLLSYTG